MLRVGSIFLLALVSSIHPVNAHSAPKHSKEREVACRLAYVLHRGQSATPEMESYITSNAYKKTRDQGGRQKFKEAFEAASSSLSARRSNNDFAEGYLRAQATFAIVKVCSHYRFQECMTFSGGETVEATKAFEALHKLVECGEKLWGEESRGANTFRAESKSRQDQATANRNTVRSSSNLDNVLQEMREKYLLILAGANSTDRDGKTLDQSKQLDMKQWLMKLDFEGQPSPKKQDLEECRNLLIEFVDDPPAPKGLDPRAYEGWNAMRKGHINGKLIGVWLRLGFEPVTSTAR